MMPVRPLFATRLYEAESVGDTLITQLGRSIRLLSREDEAGRRWSKEHRYAGYTSYGSLNDLT
ncbi:MAG TPA: hypothetical protein VM711_09495, partial [Sphingomicrobium sp.]|nr:hypothetical protein [Sphingomicrobium sp.]